MGIPKLNELPRGFENANATIYKIHKYKQLSFPNLARVVDKMYVSLETPIFKLRTFGISTVRDASANYTMGIAYKNCSEELSRKCERETGEYWHWISQIPEIQLI